jgi:hypothetical protein
VVQGVRGMKQSKFRSQCESVASNLGYELNWFDDVNRANNAFHDDGCLHIVRRGERACFDVSHGQSDSGLEQNRATREILGKLKLPVTDRCLTDEDDDEDECCPHCGRGL